MARRATSLGPKPSLSFFVCFGFCFVFFVGGLGPPFALFLFSSFPFFASNRKNLFPPRKGHFWFIFGCLPLFLLSLFWPPPFSISLSLSLSCSFSFFFLLVFLFCFLLIPCFSLFLCPFLSSLLLFHERNNIKTFNCNLFFHQYLLSFWGGGGSCLVFLSNPFFLSLFFFFS